MQTSGLITYPRLRATPKINVFVDEGTCHDLVFNVPQALLTHFSPVLHQSLQTKSDGPKIVVLQHTDKKTAGWVLSWMLGGGKTVPAAIAPQSTTNIQDDVVDILLHRLQIVSQLGISGKLEAVLVLELEQALNKMSLLSSNWVHWIYSHTSSVIAPTLRGIFAMSVINAVLGHGLTVPNSCPQSQAIAHAGFRGDLTKGLAAPRIIGRIRGMQKQKPLSVTQVRFVYTFAASEYLRKAVAQDLLNLIDEGRAHNEQAYCDYAWENTEFEEEMSKAINAKARRTAYLEREIAKKQRGGGSQYHSRALNVQPKASVLLDTGGEHKTRVLPNGGSFQPKLTPISEQAPKPLDAPLQTTQGGIVKPQRQPLEAVVANTAASILTNAADAQKAYRPKRDITFKTIAISGPEFSLAPSRNSNQKARKAQIKSIINADTSTPPASAASQLSDAWDPTLPPNPSSVSLKTDTDTIEEITAAKPTTPKPRTRVPPGTRKIKNNLMNTTLLPSKTTSQFKLKPTPTLTRPPKPAPLPKPKLQAGITYPATARDKAKKKEKKCAESAEVTARISAARAKIDLTNIFKVLEDEVEC